MAQNSAELKNMEKLPAIGQSSSFVYVFYTFWPIDSKFCHFLCELSKQTKIMKIGDFFEKILETAKKQSLVKLEKIRNADYLKLENF